MIRIPALDLILEQDTLNRMAQEWIPKSQALRSVSLELQSNMIRLTLDGRLPLVGDRSITADLSVDLRGDEVWLRLERTSVPLIPKPAVVSLVVSSAKLDALRADGPNMVLDLARLFRQYEVETHVHGIAVEPGSVRVMCLMQ